MPYTVNPFKQHYVIGQLITYLDIELIVTAFTDGFTITDGSGHGLQSEMHCDYVDNHGVIRNISFKEQSFAAVSVYNNI